MFMFYLILIAVSLSAGYILGNKKNRKDIEQTYYQGYNDGYYDGRTMKPHRFTVREVN